MARAEDAARNVFLPDSRAVRLDHRDRHLRLQVIGQLESESARVL